MNNLVAANPAIHIHGRDPQPEVKSPGTSVLDKFYIDFDTDSLGHHGITAYTVSCVLIEPGMPPSEYRSYLLVHKSADPALVSQSVFAMSTLMYRRLQQLLQAGLPTFLASAAPENNHATPGIAAVIFAAAAFAPPAVAAAAPLAAPTAAPPLAVASLTLGTAASVPGPIDRSPPFALGLFASAGPTAVALPSAGSSTPADIGISSGSAAAVSPTANKTIRRVRKQQAQSSILEAQLSPSKKKKQVHLVS